MANKETTRKLVSTEQMVKRVEEMARDVLERYADIDPLFVSFMKGSVPFTSLLMFAVTAQARERKLEFYPDVDYMTISTYGKGRSAGEPRIVMDLSPKVRVNDRVIVMLDDVLDTGSTFAFAEKHFLNRGAARVDSIVLIEKANKRTLYPAGATIIGFSSPAEKWLVGMGMDNEAQAHEAGRWMNSIDIIE